jgi:hypothetical protein
MLSDPVSNGSRIQVTDFNGTNNAANGGSLGTTFTGGAAPASATNNQHAIQVSGAGNFFQISAPSTNTWRRLKIYCGVYQSDNLIEVMDESGIETSRFRINASGSTSQIRCVNIVYRSDEDTNLIVKMTRAGSGGNISLCGYALYDLGAGNARSDMQPIHGNINLDGAADWVHYTTTTNTNRKTGVATPILSGVTNSGTLGNVTDYHNAYGNGITYTGGTNPSTATNNSTCVLNQANGGYFEFTAQSAPNSAWRRLDVFLGVWQAVNRVEVMDSSRNLLAVYEYNAQGTASPQKLSVLYRDCGGQIIVRLTKLKNYSTTTGNITLAAYAVYDIASPETNAAITVEPGGTGTVTLSDAKNVDWAHTGRTSATTFTYKLNGPRMIGAPMPLTGVLDRSTDFIPYFSWTNGTTNGTAATTATNLRDFAYGYDGMKFMMNVPAGVWKFTVFTSVWRGNGYISFEDESGSVIGTASYESPTATAGQSQYRRVSVVYSSNEAHTITVRTMPTYMYTYNLPDRGNMSFAAITAERYFDHVSIDGGDAPDIRNPLVAKAYVSPDDSLEFYSYDEVTFQWSISDSPTSGFVNIAGATSSVYKPKLADAGKYLRVVATFAGMQRERVTALPVHDLIFEPVFYDGKGNVCFGMEQKPMSVKLNYHNRSLVDPVTLSMYVCVYDAKGRLKYIDSDTIKIDPDGFVTFEASLATDIADGYYAKVFLWTPEYIPIRAAFQLN